MIGKSITHLVKYYLGVEKPSSQTTQKEREVLQKFATGAKVATEIGVFEGVNTVLIGNSLAADGTLYGIDPFFKGKLGVCYHQLITTHALRKSGLEKKVKLLPMFSFDAVSHVPDGIDFIFIDGDHSYDGIKKDWSDWSVKIKSGGFVALHDTSVPPHDPTVAHLGSFKFFNDVIRHDQRFALEETQDSLNVLRRK